MKILIVDDSERMRKYIANLLTGFHEIYECTDGIDSLDEYERIKPDILLMDISMENMNGLDASALIKNHYPSAKIFIVTNYDDESLRQKATTIGINEYILKDDLTSLRNIINRYG